MKKLVAVFAFMLFAAIVPAFADNPSGPYVGGGFGQFNLHIDNLNDVGQAVSTIAQAAHPDYRSYHTNDDWLTRDQLADVFKMIGAAVPDLRWTIEYIQTFADQIVVRGKASGTPTGELWGARPTGKSFSTMAIDVFTVRDGKLASAYHVENWMTALEQIGK